MVSPSRSSASRRRREDAGKFFTGILILLGLVASVFLVFSDNVQMVRVGLVAALWAAALGALAATRYRREAAVDKAKVGDLQKVYQLQLEREVAARREYELGVESRVRREVGADSAELAALRAELTVLRESLQRLFDGDLGYERPALRADAVRVQELPRSNGEVAAEAANDNWSDATPWDPWESRSVTPVFDEDHPEPPAFASPFDEPVTAETAAVSSADYDKARAEYASTREQFESPEDFSAFAEVEDESPEEFSAFAEVEDFDADFTDLDDKFSPRAQFADDNIPPAESPRPKPAETRHTEPITSLREQLQQVPWFETDLAPAGNAPEPTATPSVSKQPNPTNSTDTSKTAEQSAAGDKKATPDPKSPTDPKSPADAPAYGPRLPAPPTRQTPSTPIGTASSRRRRRADEDEPDTGQRLSVAEILANLRSESDR
ncbi:DUF6779 domain-containing protein [Nocardia sp. NPDC050406]|uniref:DUF6779 domain-containing protein n=1 Tax=Nocardia sp. NPDC050406 TaxID=3364318 RepID=UPI0037A1ADFB